MATNCQKTHLHLFDQSNQANTGAKSIIEFHIGKIQEAFNHLRLSLNYVKLANANNVIINYWINTQR